MFSTRIISFFFLLATFGLFACAKPIASDLVARGGTCSTKGKLDLCFSKSKITLQHLLTSLLLVLQDATRPLSWLFWSISRPRSTPTLLCLVSRTVISSSATCTNVDYADGIAPFLGPCNAIIADINAAVSVLATIDVNVSVLGDLIGAILAIVLDILGVCHSDYSSIICTLVLTGYYNRALSLGCASTPYSSRLPSACKSTSA